MKKINAYICNNLHSTVTVQNTEGVTPMFITCPECKQRAASRMHQVNQELKPTYEWFKPETMEELKAAVLPIYGDAFNEAQLQSMLNGELMYRKIVA